MSPLVVAAGILAGVVAVGSIVLISQADMVSVILEKPRLIVAAVTLLVVLGAAAGLVAVGVLTVTGGLQ